MSNALNDAIFDHIIECYPTDSPSVQNPNEDELVEDTGSSIVCKKCKQVILNYY